MMGLSEQKESPEMSSTPAAAPARAIAPADLAYIAVFAALIAALSIVPPIPVGGFGVPITLQTLGVALAGLCLGAWRGTAAVALYVLVGAAGLPVFAGGTAGIGVLLGPTGGYLLAFIVSTFLLGLAAQAVLRRGVDRLTWLWLLLAAVAVRLVVIWPIGVAGIARATGGTVGDVWAVDLAYWPGDALKIVVAVLIAVAVHKAFPRLLGR